MSNNGGQGRSGSQGGTGNQPNLTSGAAPSGGIGQQGTPGSGPEAEGHGMGQPIPGQGGQQWAESGSGGTETGTGAMSDSAEEVRGSQMSTPPTDPNLAGGAQGQQEGREAI